MYEVAKKGHQLITAPPMPIKAAESFFMRSHLDQGRLFKKLAEWIKQVIAEWLNLAISQ